MEINVLKMALLAYNDGEYADFSASDMTRCGLGEKKIREYLKQLETEGLVEDFTKPGYYSRYKLNYSGECPDYIFNQDLSVKQRGFILNLSKHWDRTTDLGIKELEKILIDYNYKQIENYMNRIKQATVKTAFDIIRDSKEIKYNILNREGTVKTDFGVKYVAKNSNYFRCQFCGETNPEKFINSRVICKECGSRHKKSDLITGRYKDLYKFLLAKAKAGFSERKYITEFTITTEDIKTQWEKQNYKDYYTGLELEDLSKLSIDRLDSSKGYIPDNIVLTDYRINVMKNDMPVEEFKNLIELLYQNKDNF